MNVTMIKTDDEVRIRFTDIANPDAIAVASCRRGERLWSVFGINKDVSGAVACINGKPVAHRCDNKFTRADAERIATLWVTEGRHIL